MTRREEETEKLMSRRLVRSIQRREVVLSEYLRYAPYIFGDPLLSGEPRDTYLKEQASNNTARKIIEGWDTTTIPMHGIMRSVMLPYLLANDPHWINRDRPHSNPLQRAKVDLYADLSNSIWTQCDATAEFQRALDDAYCKRLGWIKTEWVPNNKLPIHRWVDAGDMLVDCEVRSPRLRDRRWVAEQVVYPIETADWLAKNEWDAAKYDFTPAKWEPMGDQNEQSARGILRGAGIGMSTPYTEPPTENVRLIFVCVRGENPFTSTASLKSRRMNDPAGKDAVYDGKDHILIMEARGGYDQPDGYRIVGRIDWPYPCDPGEFPYTELYITKDNRDIYPYSIMQPAHPAQVAADLNIQSWNTQTRNQARSIVGIKPEAFRNEDEMRTALHSQEPLPVAEINANDSLQNAVTVMPLGSPNSIAPQTAAMMRENFEMIQGMNKFDTQVRANQTAYNTAKQSEAAQVKIEDLEKLVGRAITRAQKKAIMCARTNMSYEDVQEWVNVPEEVEGRRVLKPRLASNGQTVTSSELWTDDPDWDEIRKEAEVNLEPRSIRFVNPDKEAADIKEVADYQLQVFRVVGDTVGKQGVGAAQAIAESANETIKLMCKLKNILNHERFLIDMTKITAPTPPPLDVNQAMGTAAGMASEVNAQQQGAMTRLRGQGVGEEAIPPDMQGAA